MVAVDDTILDQLVQVATEDASADEVTPPLTPGSAWTAPRVEWLRGFHRDRRAGLDGPNGEATWAVSVAGLIVGSVRLKRTDEPGVLESGAWLTHRARGRGVGRAAMVAVLQLAAAHGAVALRATTTADNVRALGVLRRLGFQVTSAEHGPAVHAVLVIGSEGATAEHR